MILPTDKLIADVNVPWTQVKKIMMLYKKKVHAKEKCFMHVRRFNLTLYNVKIYKPK